MKHRLIILAMFTLFTSSIVFAQELDTIPPEDSEVTYQLVDELEQQVNDSIVKSYLKKQNSLLVSLKRVEAISDPKIKDSKRRAELDVYFFKYIKEANDTLLSTDMFFRFSVNESRYFVSDSSSFMQYLTLFNRIYKKSNDITAAFYNRDTIGSPQVKMRVSVIGFASPEGTEKYNLKLAEERALSIAVILNGLKTNDKIIFCPISRGESVFKRMEKLDNKYKRSVVLRLDCIELAPNETCKCYGSELLEPFK